MSKIAGSLNLQERKKSNEEMSCEIQTAKFQGKKPGLYFGTSDGITGYYPISGYSNSGNN